VRNREDALNVLVSVLVECDYFYHVGFHDGVCGLGHKVLREHQNDYDLGYAIGVTWQPEKRADSEPADSGS
jgi:hypothetical protein